jgi:hypothetical protein
MPHVPGSGGLGVGTGVNAGGGNNNGKQNKGGNVGQSNPSSQQGTSHLSQVREMKIIFSFFQQIESL